MFGQRQFEEVGPVNVRGVVIQVVPASAWKDHFGLLAPVDAPHEAKGSFVLNVVPEDYRDAPSWWGRVKKRFSRPDYHYAVIVDQPFQRGDIVELQCVEMRRVQAKKPLAWARHKADEGGERHE